jgi:protein O-mannosyl-transferase
MSSISKPPTDAAPDDSFVLTLPDDPASDKDWYLWAGVLALLVFVAFFPAVTGQYVWDDDRHAGLIQYLQTLDGLKRIWIPLDATAQYYPLTFTTFWLEHLLWGENTAGYHVDNMLLHAGSAVLVWRLLRRLRLPGAWLAAAIWAVHPLQAESVCWISERKNVLSGLLFFASIWFYLDYDDRSGGLAQRGRLDKGGAYALSLICFVLALLAKTVACAMPTVMLILAWWRGRKVLGRKTLLPLLPFFAVGLGMGLMTAYLEAAPGGNIQAHGADWNLSLMQRLLIASRGVWFYAGKLIVPTGLTFSYPRVMPGIGHWLYFLGAAAALAVLWIGRKEWGRGPLATVLYYLVTIFPALGFINIFPMRYSFVADHFQYLSGLGLIVLAVAAGAWIVQRLRLPAGVATGVSVAVVAALFCPAWLQAHIYQNPETLWRDTLAKNPDSWMADDNLGVELFKLGEQSERDAANDQSQGDPDAAADETKDAQARFQEAEQLFHEALKWRPQNYATHNALGLLYRHLGRWQEAEAELKTAVDQEEQDERAHRLIAPYVNYADVYQFNHPGADVRVWLDKAMDLTDLPRTSPSVLAMARLAYGDYWIRRASAAAKENRPDEEMADLLRGIEQLNAAVAAAPENLGSLFDLGQAYERLGLLDQKNADAERAAGHPEEAAQDEFKSHQVDDAMAMKNYTAALSRVQNGRYAPALAGIGKLYRRNVLVRDNQADAVHDLLMALQFFRDAVSIDPAVPDAAQLLPDVSRQLMAQGEKAREHETTWEPLREKLAMLAEGSVTKKTAAETEQAAETALWPLAAEHPLRGPLMDLRAAIRGYQSPVPPTDAAAAVSGAAKAVLADWNHRKTDADALSDVEAAALCYQGAITADEHSAEAWRNLQGMVELLSSPVIAKPDPAGAAQALKVAQFVLDQHRAATQPFTQSSTQPATRPNANLTVQNGR